MAMIAARIDALELIDAWQEGDPTMRERFAFPIDALAGAASTAAVYFEVRPGHHCGRHVHTAEELLLILAGETEARVGEETARLPTGGLVVAPAGVPHDLYCVGDDTLKVLGFFPSAAVITTFDAPVAPTGRATFIMGAPPDEEAH